MIQFFRKIRQKLLSQNRVTRYLAYAVGEIFLVMIGILMALQINTWNEKRKDNQLLAQYTQNLITELKSDLLRYNELDSANKVQAQKIQNYLNYYNLKSLNLDTLVGIRDTLRPSLRIFTSSTFTIQDLISTGNLKLFSNETKNAILKFQSIQEETKIYVDETFQAITSLLKELDKNEDLLYRFKYSPKQHNKVKNWRFNLNSDNYLLDNNYLARFFGMYSFQERIHEDLKEATNELLEELENSKK